jgi:Tfp pilus assembly PilM family ATPase
LHCVVRDIFKNAFDSCLVNITYEATEIGIVRDGTLQYATHTPFGSFSLAREIADITSVPLLEAFQSLHNETPYAFMQNLPESQKAEVEKVIEAYTARVADLFHETGDDLSIPKQIFLHADLANHYLETSLKKRPNVGLSQSQISGSLRLR